MDRNIGIYEILEQAVRDEDVSDIFLVAGLPVTMKRNGRQKRIGDKMMMPNVIGQLVDEIYQEAHRDRTRLERGDRKSVV